MLEFLNSTTTISTFNTSVFTSYFTILSFVVMVMVFAVIIKNIVD